MAAEPVTVRARVHSVKDLSYEDSDKIPRLVLWAAGDEIAEMLKIVAWYCGVAHTLRITHQKTVSVQAYLRKVTFGVARDALVELDVALASPLQLPIGASVVVEFAPGV